MFDARKLHKSLRSLEGLHNRFRMPLPEGRDCYRIAPLRIDLVLDPGNGWRDLSTIHGSSLPVPLIADSPLWIEKTISRITQIHQADQCGATFANCEYESISPVLQPNGKKKYHGLPPRPRPIVRTIT